MEILFIFDRFPDHGDYRQPRPNRGRPDFPPVGVFAGRGPRRPNRIGVTCCAIESVHGRELTVVGLVAVSGTPVIDVKPVMSRVVLTQRFGACLLPHLEEGKPDELRTDVGVPATVGMRVGRACSWSRTT
ncbi:hypothetical protein Pa4123_86670 [Phytohabitans aurantiacus]|uniref:TsaA-like domain-containing protein n=1 Tax=Phytohabitans aurantiacus TaxID=3016789 RepID=A0ABQ5R9F2_9ACTN|nr:hypothetical protein Pa4123_86670 [Phytohabitans aurantiacus]